MLTADFKEYFPENLTSQLWIRNLFHIEDILPASVTNEKDELTELSHDRSLQKMFNNIDLTEF
jgi:hypothetical protein